MRRLYVIEYHLPNMTIRDSFAALSAIEFAELKRSVKEEAISGDHADLECIIFDATNLNGMKEVWHV